MSPERMTTSTLTLTSFLLARIAEDEEDLREARISEGPEWWMPAHWTRERGLAECEAKRRIVDLATNQHTSGPDLDEVVRILALPYADHPDFRDEWRP